MRPFLLDQNSALTARGIYAASTYTNRHGFKFSRIVTNVRTVKRHKCRAPMAASGFTLIELVIGASLAAIILVAAYLCLNAALATQKVIEPRTEAIQNARVAMALMAADLRAACPLSKDYQFLGTQRTIEDTEADNLDFATHNYSPSRPNEGDYCQVSYFVEQDPDSHKFTLWRRRNPTNAPDPLSGGTREEIADGIKGVRFEYYDGDDWYDDWGEIKPRRKETDQSTLAPNLTGMPEAVRITLWLDSNPHAKKATQPGGVPAQPETEAPAFVFQTVARLNLADISQKSTSSSSSSQNSTDNSGQNQQPGGANGMQQ